MRGGGRMPAGTRRGGPGGKIRSALLAVFVICIFSSGVRGQSTAAKLVKAQRGGGVGQSPLAIGTPIPDFNLPGVDGKNHKLAEYAKAKVLAVIFVADHCFFSQIYEARLRKLHQDYGHKGVTVVAVSPSDPDAVRLDEQSYTDVGDGLEDMKARAEYRKIEWPYLYDGANQTFSAKLGVSATPEIFVFDQARRLRYRGALDDNIDESKVKQSYARQAIDELLAGGPVRVATTEVKGSPVGWAAKRAGVKQELARIESDPIEVSLASKDELGKLRGNPTGKLLLVNFWATWCGPCVGEFPALQATYRMYRGRGLAFETVSENDPEEKASVLEFLHKEHATSPNLLFSDSDVYAMQAAFDPAMPGAVPFTVLLAPNGDVLYQQTGDLDTLKLRRAILANLPVAALYPGEQEYWSASK